MDGARTGAGHRWARLAARWPELVISDAEGLLRALRALRGRQVYLAAPVSACIEEGDARGCIERAAYWSAWLLAAGLSPVCPAIDGVAAMLARGDDRIGLALQGFSHEEWMGRWAAVMEASAACMVAPVRHATTSRGVFEEAVWFLSAGRPVLFPGLREGG